MVTRCTATPSAPSSGREIHVPQTIEGAFAQGAQEMIVVLPDSKTVHNGSMYSSSVTTGDFEKFVSRDVVAYIDAHYRTIPKRTSRGLVGHSMGGYGASRIGMKHSDVFGSLYIMSPCCLSARGAGTARTPRTGEGARGRQDAGRFREAAVRPARAARVGRRVVAESEEPAAVSRPADEGRRGPAGSPREMGGQRAAGLCRSVHRQPEAVPRHRDRRGRPGRPARRMPRKLHEILDSYGIANTFEIYPGTHTSAVAVRFQNSRHAVLQQEPVLRQGLPLEGRWSSAVFRMARTGPRPLYHHLGGDFRNSSTCSGATGSFVRFSRSHDVKSASIGSDHLVSIWPEVYLPSRSR